MKKYLLCVMLFALSTSLCACVAVGDAEVSEPQSMPELESIVEPVTEEAESQQAYPGKTDTPIIITSSEQSVPVINDFAPPVASVAEASQVAAAPEAETAETAQSEAPKWLEALAPDFRLDSGRIEQELLRLINGLREEAGVHALGIEDSMLLAARTRAAEAYESFSHTRPDGTPYNTAFDEVGFSYAGKWHGENLSSLSLASGSLPEEEIAQKMFDGLKSSPGHYRNMTEEHFVQAGIGVAVTYTDGGVDITSAQMFAGL